MRNRKWEIFNTGVYQNIERLFIISDTHFFHASILEYEPTRRIYTNTHESFEEYLIERWNDTITDRDTVIHLGDFAFNEAQRFTDGIKLHGKKILIAGNHDYRKSVISQINKIFDYTVKDGTILVLRKDSIEEVLTGNRFANGVIIELPGINILLSHYPVFQYDEYDKEIIELINRFYKQYNCRLNIHGHVHNKDEIHHDLFNVSIERTDFRPIRLYDIIKKWKNMQEKG